MVFLRVITVSEHSSREVEVVFAVHRLGLTELEAAVGEDDVVAPDTEQLRLAFGDALGVEAFHAPYDEPGRGVELLLLAGKRGTQQSSSSSQTAAVYSIGVQASSAMFTMASRTVFWTATAREKRTPALWQASTTLWEKYAESARTMICAVLPIARTVASASRSRLATPLPEPAAPLRSLVATMTGAHVPVLTVTIWKCRPRTV
jgi:hypothetical protein